MAEGENRRAIENFKEAVRVNSENIDAYIKIGIILRNEGLYNNAIRVHKDLLLRANLEEDELIEIKKNLALDYWQAGLYDKAEGYFSELKSNKKLFDWLAPYLVKIYEEKNNWATASEVFQQSAQSSIAKGKMRLAMYKVRQGLAQVEQNDEKSARVLFKEAVKIDSSCAAGYVYLGDSYWREDRKSDAINAWNDLCKKIPGKAHLAFQRLEKAWYEKGQFSKIEELYQGILDKDSENIYAIIALANIYRKKGEYDQSLKLLNEAHKKEKFAEIIQAQIIKILMDKSEFEEAAKKALELVEKKDKPFYDRQKSELDDLDS
jgi:lipopolysaccharide biosynthesis regulator YciM